VAEDDLRLFMRDMIRRNEKTIEELVRGMQRHTDAMVARLEEQRMALVDMRAEIADQRKQIQANTRAVLSVLDRLN
jgi:hypothetical protein